MGWWSTCVMGGDTPYDVAGAVEEVLAVRVSTMHIPDCWTKPQQARIRRAIKKYGGASKLLEFAASFGSEATIARQVIGLLLISCGAPLTTTDKEQIIATCESDDWAKRSDERKQVMEALITAVRGYTNKPITIEQEGLFDKLFG